MSIKVINGYKIEDIFCHTRITKDGEFIAGYDNIIKNPRIKNENVTSLLDWYEKVNEIIGESVFPIIKSPKEDVV